VFYEQVSMQLELSYIQIAIFILSWILHWLSVENHATMS